MSQPFEGHCERRGDEAIRYERKRLFVRHEIAASLPLFAMTSRVIARNAVTKQSRYERKWLFVRREVAARATGSSR
jgi:hypothetical protein